MTTQGKIEQDMNIRDLEPSTQYLINKIKTLEEMNTILKEKAKKIESERRYTEKQKIKYEKQIKQLKSEIENLRTPPQVVGEVVDVLKNRRVIVKSTTGTQFVVNVSKFVDVSDLFPGTQVSMNSQTLAIIDILPKSKDPLVYGMEILESPQVSYSDIGGLEKQILEIKETVELPLTKPQIFERIGVEPPKGVLLYGPPGTGKTLLAKAVAYETNAVFIRVVGSELVQKYIGEGSRLVRELFKMANEKSPSIIFIDEIDSIGAKRLDNSTSGDREVQRTLMQLLAEMDGFNPRGDVRLIAATNRPDILDPALTRPGRFDRFIAIPLPDKKARIEILKIHSKNMKLSKDVDFEEISMATENTNGSELKAIVMEAGMLAVRKNRKSVKMEDFRDAVNKMLNTDKKMTYSENMFV